MTRPVTPLAARLVESLEACVQRVYDDKQPQKILRPGDYVMGTLTAGVGHTGGLTIGQPVSKLMIDQWLDQDLDEAARRLALKVKADVINELTEHEYSALLSFVFNLGTPGTTIWAVLNGRKFDQVPIEMMRFDKARDRRTGQLVEVPGLMHRRAAEVTFWKTGDVVSAVAIVQTAPVAAPPSSVTRGMDTPPTPMDTKPLRQSRSFMTAGLTALTTVAAAGSNLATQTQGAISQVSSAISPFADKNEFIAKMVSNLTVAAAAVAVASLVFAYLKKRGAQIEPGSPGGAEPLPQTIAAAPIPPSAINPD